MLGAPLPITPLPREASEHMYALPQQRGTHGKVDLNQKQSRMCSQHIPKNALSFWGSDRAGVQPGGKLFLSGGISLGRQNEATQGK
jgi:hypothetical protein